MRCTFSNGGQGSSGTAIASVVQRVCSTDTRYECEACRYPNNRRRCCSYSTTEPLLERLVRALDLCRARPGGSALDGNIDLWRTLADVAKQQWPEEAHYGTCAMLRYAYERCDGGPPSPCPGRNHPGPAPKASWVRWCRPRPISISDLRAADGRRMENDDDGEEEMEEDPKERVDSRNTSATVNGYTHDCCLLFDVARWLGARDLLVLPSSPRMWPG